MLPPAETAKGFALGAEYSMLGQIGKVSSSLISADQITSFMRIAANRNLEIGYANQQTVVKTTDVPGFTGGTHISNIYRADYTVSARLPLKAKMALSGLFYTGEGFEISQQAIQASIKYGNATISVGANHTGGDIEETMGRFASIRFAVSPELVVFAEWNQKDINKIAVNRHILPSSGINCASCGNDAASVGLAFKIDDWANISILFFDIKDLNSPTLSISTRWK